MSRVLTFCWREWRAQRALLLAYTLLGLACLGLAFLLLPAAHWEQEAQPAIALSWFVAIGVFGVCAFVAPGLVRSEFGAKNDQFVRRLPGALWPSFGGKLLFLALTAAALPLACLLAGEVFLLAIDRPWHDLFAWDWTGDVQIDWPWTAPWLAGAALIVPWVWAVGTWMPKGRMAVGGALLFGLLLGVAAFAVLWQCPGLAATLAWQSWLWWVAPAGLVVAAVSWTIGRRGGGPLRSAGFGLAASACALIAPAWWLGGQVRPYHWPDAQQLQYLSVAGSTPDGRHLLAYGSELFVAMNSAREGRMPAPPVPFRIDLQTGEAIQLGSSETTFGRQLAGPWYSGAARRRFWYQSRAREGDAASPHAIFDLETLASEPLSCDVAGSAAPPSIAARFAAEDRAAADLRAPDGRRVWWEGRDLCFENGDAAVARVRWPAEPPSYITPMGHGFLWHEAQGWCAFDLAVRATRELRDVPKLSTVRFVRGVIVHGHAEPAVGWRWFRRCADGSDEPIAALAGYWVRGLFDDDHLLAMKAARADEPVADARLVLYHVRDHVAMTIELPETVAGAALELLGPEGSLLPRDSDGCVWLLARRRSGATLLRVDVAARTYRGSVPWPNEYSLLDWPACGVAIVQAGTRILRVDVETGATTQLFPRR